MPIGPDWIASCRTPLAAGRLQMLAVRGRARADLRTGQLTRVPMGVYRVDIDVPDVKRPGRGGRTVFEQGRQGGGAMFARLEGAWFADGCLYVTSTSGGNAKMGQVWELIPGPRGGLVLCEDGTANPCVHTITREGQIVRFASNSVVLNGERNGITGDIRSKEIAGATFCPDGRWLSLNLQHPGFTVAITGPWERGPI